MRVICIDNSPGESNCGHRLLKEGEIYTARQSEDFPKSYKLAEVPIDPQDGMYVSFRKVRFIPLSEIDEKEFDRNYIKQLTP